MDCNLRHIKCVRFDTNFSNIYSLSLSLSGHGMQSLKNEMFTMCI